MDLNTIWYLLIGIFITGYAILDGYDLGVGFWHLFARGEHDRLTNMNAIGPLWDGNEVWLVAGAGTLFAVFPVVYATILSALYPLFFLFLVSLIFRAVSIEVRNKVISARWKRSWDWGFGLGSITVSFMFGLMLGNILRGLPVNEEHVISGYSLLSMFNPYSVFIGFFTLSLFAMHGAVYMTLKTDGAYLKRMKKNAFITWIIFIIFYPAAVAATIYVSPFLYKTLVSRPLSIPFIIINAALIICIAVALRNGRHGWAFTASSLTIVTTTGLLGLSLFPFWIPSGIDLVYSISAYNGAAGTHTLKIMLAIVIMAIPVITAYTIFINRVFKGKAETAAEAYD